MAARARKVQRQAPSARGTGFLRGDPADLLVRLRAERLRRMAVRDIPAPKPAARGDWPPDYVSVRAWRAVQLARYEVDGAELARAKEHYAQNPVDFIVHWCDTYDPRNVGSGVSAKMPLVLFPRQVELVEFLVALVAGQQSGLVEKCRDMGATWVCCAFSVWLWIFHPGAAVGWGSRKSELVDRIGEPDSIFEKMRMIIRALPRAFLPTGLRDEHLAFMKIINPENGATISGESGDNIGRGGRKLIYFKDESAHYERPEKIEAALADTTRTQVDISSVNGLGNVFHRKREAGVVWEPGAAPARGAVSVFIMDWRDHPAKTQEWYDERKLKATNEGMSHIFAQEVERNYSAAVEGVIIPAEWVTSAIDAHLKVTGLDEGAWIGGLDVADSGGDRNALALRKGVILRHIEEWGAPDTGETARRAIAGCEKFARVPGPNYVVPVALQYDCIGVGSGVKAETNRLRTDNLMPAGLVLTPWDAGAGPLFPDKHVEEGDANNKGDEQTPKNKDFYMNLKAQGWWQLRRRFERTHRAVTEGAKFDAGDLISLPSGLPMLRQLQKELSQPTAGKSTRLKLLVNKTPEGTRSPNLADAAMMAFWPAETHRVLTSKPLRI